MLRKEDREMPRLELVNVHTITSKVDAHNAPKKISENSVSTVKRANEVVESWGIIFVIKPSVMDNAAV